jgi:hypothetical protein
LASPIRLNLKSLAISGQLAALRDTWDRTVGQNAFEQRSRKNAPVRSHSCRVQLHISARVRSVGTKDKSLDRR